jgi:hypothetical protein
MELGEWINMYVCTFWTIWGWFLSVWCAVSADHKCPSASILLDGTVTDGDVWGPYLIPHAVLQPQLRTALGFSRVTSTLRSFFYSRTSLAAFLPTPSSKSITLGLQPWLIWPAHTFQQEHHFGTTTITDLAKLCREVMSPATGKVCDITYYIVTNPLSSFYFNLRSVTLV